MEGISSSGSAPWIELPRDVTANILHRLEPMEILKTAQDVCTTWRSVSREPSLWRVVHMKQSSDRRMQPYDVIACRIAVDRSRGELIDLSIEHFCTYGLLQYLSDRLSNLKRLRLVRCNSISAHDLTSAVKKFPLLEELHIFVTPSIRDVDIESISVSCPLLKSFTFNIYRGLFLFPKEEFETARNSHALSIAKNMPNLCHLALIGNPLSNEGLKAILGGCPNLESLDLRKCYCVGLGYSEVGRRCSQQIKELKNPCDSIADCDWYQENRDYHYNNVFG